MPHALISGARIAGLSSAFWLQRAGWDVTVLERSESFRDGGHNIDVRGVAREVLDRMGLAEGVRSDTRALLFGDTVERHELGINMAFGTIRVRKATVTCGAATTRPEAARP